MKQHLLLLTFLTLLGCSEQQSSSDNEGFYGEKFVTTNATTMEALTPIVVSGKPILAIVRAKVKAVCQAKGCWVSIENKGGADVRVSFKDYAFFVPKDCTGKTVIIKGKASIETTTVEELKHFAEDDGKSKEEIEKITQPKQELVFEASGLKFE
jgi:hypothetical protein